MGSVGTLIAVIVMLLCYISADNERAELKQQIETTKQCLRNSQYEEWELCYE